MFSSILPGVSTNMKFMHNAPSKPSNRYVKSSTNPSVTYLPPPNLYDLGYLSIIPTEGSPPNWYPNNSYNPPYGPDYAIYSTPASHPYNYDQSAQFLDFEDISSIATDSTVSPAFSTDSLETLKSPVDSEPLIDKLDAARSENRAFQSSLPIPISSQVATVDRTLSTHPLSGDHIPSGQFSANINFRSTPFQPPPFIGDDDTQSTISELEVEERDRIAKMNAEYNAISHTAFLDNPPSQGPKYSADRFRESNTTLQMPSMQTRPCLRLPASQPRHPDLNFPQRPIGNEKMDLPPSAYRIYANPLPLDLSPPSVERLPSQLPPEQNVNMNKILSQSQSSTPAGSRNHEGSPDSDRSRIVQNRTSSPTGFNHSISQAGLSSNMGINPQQQSYISRAERSQALGPSSLVPAEIIRKFRSPVVITNGHSPQSVASDGQESLQYKHQSRPDGTSLIQPSPTTKNQFHPSPDSRQNAGVIKSSPLAQINKATESESAERISLGTDLRKDTKTPVSGRGLSYVQSSLDSPSQSSQDIHSSPDMRDKGAHKSSPKSFLVDKSSHLDNRFPPEANLSSGIPLRDHPPSVSVSNWPLPKEDPALRRTTKDIDDDREFERNRRLRTERGAIPKFPDAAFRGTAPSLHPHGPLHLSPEGALAASLEPDSQAALVAEPRSTPSKTTYDQASVPNPIDSPQSRRGQYNNFTKPQPESTKREGNDVRIHSGVLQSSPLNKFATTSDPSSKVILDFPPTTALPEPHRRHSDGDQASPPFRPPLSGRNSAPLVRSVRWTENLIAPSPILAPPRRKGWFNRRGDQLWTNNGDYRLPRSGEEYSLELNDYPEPGDGWMNEDGVRIDMTHCRIPKALPRPALKKP